LTKQPTTTLVADTIQFLHMACFSPSTSTFLKALKNGNFATWPMLSSENIKKYLTKSEATAMGHLNLNNARTHSPQSANNRRHKDPAGLTKHTPTSWTSTSPRERSTLTKLAASTSNPVAAANASLHFIIMTAMPYSQKP
jgi:hypothetical protein